MLFFYPRIFEDTSRTFNIVLYTLGALSTGWLIAALLSTGFQCSPTQAAYDPLVQGHCFPQWPWFLGTAISSTIIDVCILLAPLPGLWRLQMPITRRLGIIVIFLAGYSVIVCSIGRIVSLGQLGNDYARDITYLGRHYVSWVACEPAVSVISVSLPVIFQFAKRIHEHGWLFAWSGKKRTRSKKPSPAPPPIAGSTSITLACHRAGCAPSCVTSTPSPASTKPRRRPWRVSTSPTATGPSQTTRCAWLVMSTFITSRCERGLIRITHEPLRRHERTRLMERSGWGCTLDLCPHRKHAISPACLPSCRLHFRVPTASLCDRARVKLLLMSRWSRSA